MHRQCSHCHCRCLPPPPLKTATRLLAPSQQAFNFQQADPANTYEPSNNRDNYKFLGQNVNQTRSKEICVEVQLQFGPLVDVFFAAEPRGKLVSMWFCGLLPSGTSYVARICK